MDRSHSVRVTGHDSPHDHSAIARRPSVRIVERRRLPLAAKISLLAAVAASMVAFAAWRWWSAEPPEEAVYRRSIVDVDLTWKCLDGHTFTAAGQIEDRACAMCDQPAFPITTYECRLHGPFEVAVRFARTPDGSSYVSHIRLLSGDWVPASEGLRCPRCGQSLQRSRSEPEPRGKKRSG